MYAKILKANPNHDSLGRFSSEENAINSHEVEESTGTDGSEWVTIKDKSGRGSLMMSRTGGGDFQVRESLVHEDHRGKGVGSSLYKAAFKFADGKSADVTSDLAVSESANRVWESLQKSGYSVHKQPDVRMDHGKLRSFSAQDFAGVRLDLPSGIPPWRYKHK